MLCKNDLEDNIATYIIDRVPDAKMNTVFDVGANVGWFTFQFANVYRDAEFHLFEPVPSLHGRIPATFDLVPALKILERSKLNKTALGFEIGTACMSVLPDVTVNRIVGQAIGLPGPDWPTENVAITTGDEYCRRNSIERINYLKIDAEGYDMNVLIGFTRMLSLGNVDFVQVEASHDHDNKEHIHFDSFLGLLRCHQFRLFRFINQASSGSMPFMTRSDVVFIHQSAAARLKGNIQ